MIWSECLVLKVGLGGIHVLFSVVDKNIAGLITLSQLRVCSESSMR